MKPRIGSHQNGSAVIVVLALLAILLVYLGFNAITLHTLSQEVKAVEKRQVHRLQALGGGTNAQAVAGTAQDLESAKGLQGLP